MKVFKIGDKLTIDELYRQLWQFGLVTHQENVTEPFEVISVAQAECAECAGHPTELLVCDAVGRELEMSGMWFDSSVHDIKFGHSDTCESSEFWR